MFFGKRVLEGYQKRTVAAPAERKHDHPAADARTDTLLDLARKRLSRTRIQREVKTTAKKSVRDFRRSSLRICQILRGVSYR